ncbi:MAG: hypothetical protein ABJA60_05710, partial [Nitrosospira sp.]
RAYGFNRTEGSNPSLSARIAYKKLITCSFVMYAYTYIYPPLRLKSLNNRHADSGFIQTFLGSPLPFDFSHLARTPDRGI